MSQARSRSPAPKAPVPAREQLLGRVVDHLLEHGLGDASLRELAAAVGSSHRMLIYHFGSRDGLLSAVVEDVERRQAERLQELSLSGAPEELIMAMHRHLASPDLDPLERLFVELYGRALQGDEAARHLIDPGVRDWLAALSDLYERFGFSRREAHGEATLALATARGLILDRLATGEAERVDAAARLYAAAVMQRLGERARTLP
jgi:AcrR family transcriptional regulator